MAEVTFTYTPQPAPACYPSDVNGMLALIAGGSVQGTIPDNAGGGIIVQPTPPPSSLSNKAWLKTDTAGRPLGWYAFYNGVWRRVYTGVAIGEIRIWSGPIANIFDGTGLGAVGGDLDGWALCNGQNGTPDLRDKFIVSANSYSGDWETLVDGTGAIKHSGGISSFRIAAGNLPPLVWGTGTGNRAQSGPNGATIDGGNIQLFYPITDNQGNATGANTPIYSVPPFVAMGYILFVGYA